MLIWNAAQLVMHILQTKSCEVTVHIEGIEMCLQGSVLPLPLPRHTHAAFLRRERHGNKVEAVLICSERLMRKDRHYSFLSIFIKCPHLLFCISFSNDGHIDALFRRPSSEDIFMRSRSRIQLADQYIFRVDAVLHLSSHISIEIKELYCNFRLDRRHRKKKHIFK